jgi:hypothetical protein
MPPSAESLVQDLLQEEKQAREKIIAEEKQITQLIDSGDHDKKQEKHNAQLIRKYSPRPERKTAGNGSKGGAFFNASGPRKVRGIAEEDSWMESL